MGGAQPLAATMAGAAILCVEVDRERIERRLQTRYLDEAADSLDDALARVRAAAARGPRAVGRAARERRRGRARARASRGALRPRHRSDRGARSVDRLRAGRARRARGGGVARVRSGRVPQARACVDRRNTCAALLEFARNGSYVFDYGNNLRGEAHDAGVTEAFSYPGFVPAYIRPLFCRGVGPFRWAALSGDPADIAAIDETLRELFPDDVLLQRWLELAPERVAFQGLPARICWLGLRRPRARRGSRSTSSCERARVGARRDRARPPRLRLGGVSVPRDRGDARRLRRDRGLADPERAR